MVKRTGRVAITGASGQVGTLLRKELADLPNEVTALNRGEDWGPALASAEVIFHFAGALVPGHGSSYEEANVDTARTVADHAGSDTGRIVFLSYVGASPDSGNEYLRSKYEAEQALLSTGLPVTIFRCLHIFGPPASPGPTVSAFLAEPRHDRVKELGNGQQRISPLYIGDVVDACLKAGLDADSPTGVFELGGPDEMSMDEFIQIVNGGGVRVSHVPAFLARVLGRMSQALTPSLVDLLIRDNLAPGTPETTAAFGLELHGISQVWAPT
jgi:uncharacterized protein YbjT (DUF2867 family)